MSNQPDSPTDTAADRSAKFLLAPVIIAVLALLGGLLLQARLSQAPELQNATLYPDDFRPVPAFALQDQNGQPFSEAQLQGKWSVMFFGFTHCPDVCPTTLAILSQAWERLGALREQVQVILVSVDPERDTQQQRKDYIEYFNPQFIALGGEPERIQALARAMYIHYARVDNPHDPDDYLVDHSAALLVINPKGRRHAIITPPILPGVIAADLTAMMESYP